MQVTIDGQTADVAPDATVLEAIHALGKDVPTLCFDDRQAPFGACRVCLVKAEGVPGLIPACTTPCRDGMQISTRDETAHRVVKAIVELVLSELPRPAGGPHRAGAGRASDGRRQRRAGPARPTRVKHDERHPYLAFQHELCICCGRCVRACDEVQGAFALTATGRGFEANITAGLDAGFKDSTCVSCGACADTCPTDAITETTLLRLNGKPPEESV